LLAPAVSSTCGLHSSRWWHHPQQLLVLVVLVLVLLVQVQGHSSCCLQEL
jgi:hypothetical protein